MAKNYHSELRNRPDLAIIAELVEPGFRVLDLGCGDGSFLKMLKNEHGAEVLGMEIDPDLLAESIANGVPVVQSVLDDELDFAEDNSFDLVILSQTLQQMRRPDQLMRKIVRVGKLAAVSFLANMLSSQGMMTVTPVWWRASRTVAWPTVTPGTSVILSSGPVGIQPTRMP